MTYYPRNPIKRHDGGRGNDYARVPNALLRDETLSPAARLVGAYLRSHSDGYQVSHVSIAENLHYGRGKVRNAFEELIASRWLAVTAHRTSDGKRAYEVYHVPVDRQFTNEEMLTLNTTVVLPPKRDETADEADTNEHDEHQPQDEPEADTGYTAPKGPMTHATADEYLPELCSDCRYYGRACGNVSTDWAEPEAELKPDHEEFWWEAADQKPREQQEELCPF